MVFFSYNASPGRIAPDTVTREDAMINGSYLRQLRKTNNFTLVQLSEEIGCTASFLSQIERGQKEPSLATLRKLSEVLNVAISALLLSDGGDETHFSTDDKPSFTVVRRDCRAAYPAQDHIAHCEVLTPAMNGKFAHSLHGAIAFLQPGIFCAEKTIVHPTRDEFLYVVSGSVTAFLDGEEVLLRTGDCVYINAGTPHNFYNGSNEECILLSATN